MVVLADAGRRAGGRGTPRRAARRQGRVAFRACPDTGITRPALGLKRAGRAEAAGRAEEGRRRQYVAHDPRPAASDRQRRPGQAGRRHPHRPLCRALEVGLHTDGAVRGGPHACRRAGGGRARAAERPTCAERARSAAPVRGAGAAAAGPCRRWPGCRRRRGDAAPASPTAGWRLYDRAATGSTPSGCCDCPSGAPSAATGDGHGRRRDRRRRAPAAGARRRALAGALSRRRPPRTSELIERMLASWAGSDAGHAGCAGLERCARGAAVRVRVDGVLFRGRFDLYHRRRPGPRWWSTTRPTGWASARRTSWSSDSYRHQVAIYALAALLGGAGSGRGRLRLPGPAPRRGRCAAARAPTSESARGRHPLVAGRSGRAGSSRGQAPWCAECPALDLLCAGPALRAA